MYVFDVSHESAKKALNFLREVSVHGVQCESHDGVAFESNLVLCFYVAHIVEIEDQLSLEPETHTSFPCHRCMAPMESLLGPTKAESRSFPMRQKLMSECLSTYEKLDRSISLSMHCKLPILAPFPFVGIHSLNETYSIFRFEPMHNFYLLFSKLLHNSLVGTLFDKKRVTAAMVTSACSSTIFKQVM